MKKETLFRKVLVSERVPSEDKWNDDWFIVGWEDSPKYHTQGFVHNGKFIQNYKNGHESINKEFDPQPKWWLEEIQLPSEEKINDMAEELALPNSVKFGANYILGFINNKK